MSCRAVPKSASGADRSAPVISLGSFVSDIADIKYSSEQCWSSVEYERVVMSFAIASLLVRMGSASMENGLGGMNRPFVLINSNVVRPPVNPLGLEYVGEALIHGGVRVEVVDLSWEKDWRSVLATRLPRQEPRPVARAAARSGGVGTR